MFAPLPAFFALSDNGQTVVLNPTWRLAASRQSLQHLQSPLTTAPTGRGLKSGESLTSSAFRSVVAAKSLALLFTMLLGGVRASCFGRGRIPIAGLIAGGVMPLGLIALAAAKLSRAPNSARVGGILFSEPATQPRKIPAMISSLIRRALALSALTAVALLAPARVFAGTPLICHPYAIGTATSLPGTDGDWKGVNPAYDRTHLVQDTLALLTPDTPVIVRMETLRRAAIYATAGMRGWSTKEGFSAEDRANVTALLEKLRVRAKDTTGPDNVRALAIFDVGFFSETLRHANVDAALDGYALLVKAHELRGPDAEMDFALALASSWPMHRADLADHLARARAAAKPGTLLAANLESHFGKS